MLCDIPVRAVRVIAQGPAFDRLRLTVRCEQGFVRESRGKEQPPRWRSEPRYTVEWSVGPDGINGPATLEMMHQWERSDDWVVFNK